MTTVATYTKTGVAAKTKATLPAAVFGLKVESHELVHQAYETVRGNAHGAAAKTKTRAEVRGGGRKPWRQKGLGRARVGSIRSPIWRGGGITFGPSGQQNHHRKLNKAAKHTALRQALSLKAQADAITVLEQFDGVTGKVKDTAKLLGKLEHAKQTLLVIDRKDAMIDRATRNLPRLQVVEAGCLNVYDVLNADGILITKDSLEVLKKWLVVTKTKTKPTAKTGGKS